jgi:hypothetical protein
MIPIRVQSVIGKRNFLEKDADSWCDDETQEHLNMEM